jgi:hypothetical protein
MAPDPIRVDLIHSVNPLRSGLFIKFLAHLSNGQEINCKLSIDLAVKLQEEIHEALQRATKFRASDGSA